jgi:DNA-binding LacI/PurR family transcriptional regulator
MVNITDIANEAGVSVATVSRVINGNSKVQPETRERVIAAIRKYNYKPNAWGRSLRKRESRSILIFLPNITNPYYASIVSGIEDTSRKNGYSTILCITDSNQNKESEFSEMLISGRADGAIFLSTFMENSMLSKLAKKYPIVQCSEYCLDESIPHVSIDNFAASRQVIDYLIKLKHENICYIGSTNKYISTRQREDGYFDAMKNANIDVNAASIAYADDDYSFSSGLIAARKLISQRQKPSAIFCISDVIALAAIKVAHEYGLRVPEDISVVGFDDVEYASMFTPTLTTVYQPCYSMGVSSANALLKLINGRTDVSSVYLSHKLIIRESTGYSEENI